MQDFIAQRAELIFQELGGLREVRKVMTDSQIVDITLFNGLTTTIFPYYNIFNTDDLNGYSYLNLYDAQYLDNTAIHIFDSNYNHLYTTQPVFTTVNGLESYYFGITEEDKTFLKSIKHCSVLFLKYETATSSQLMQIIISHKLPANVYKENSNKWLSSINSQIDRYNTLNELILKLPNLDNIYVYTLKGSLSNNYTETEIVHNPLSNYSIYSNNDYAYINIDSNLWINIRHYKNAPQSLDLLLNEDIDYVTNYLLTDGFTRLSLKSLVSYNNTHVFTKSVNDGYTQEVVVTLDSYSCAQSITTKLYKLLETVNLTGNRAEAITVNTNLTLHVNPTSLTKPLVNNLSGLLIRRAHQSNVSTSYAVDVSPIKCTGEVIDA